MSVQSELKACKTAASITEVVDGFEVLRTASVAETFRLYAAITKRLAVCQHHVFMSAANTQRPHWCPETAVGLAQRTVIFPLLSYLLLLTGLSCLAAGHVWAADQRIAQRAAGWGAAANL